MAWVAFDRAVKDAETFGLDGPVERWRQARDAIHAEVCTSGYDAQRNTFVQSYGSPHLDASLLLIPQVGFLPPDDPRVRGTVDAIERDLVVDGLVLRYSTATHVDALPPGEGAFLPSFWLADSLVLMGRREDGEALFERLLALRNDVGLLAEKYDTRERHMLGNFPQALTHMALINTARLLSIPEGQAKRASEKGERPTVVRSNVVTREVERQMKVLVVDVGGSHIKCVATDHRKRAKFKSGPKMTPERMVESVLGITPDAAANHRFDGLDARGVEALRALRG